MRLWKNESGEWVVSESLIGALPADFSKKQVISAVGAGGKTSVLHRLAAELIAQGKRVALTTTTHMSMPDDEDLLTDDLAIIRKRLRDDRFVLAGRPAGGGKMSGVPDPVYREICALADIVFVEADGSKRLPLKVPAAHEPVIPDHTTLVLVLAGMGAVGRSLEEACHRSDLAEHLLGADGGHVITPADIARLLMDCYLVPPRLEKKRTGTVILNQADSGERFRAAAGISDLLSPVPCLISALLD